MTAHGQPANTPARMCHKQGLLLEENNAEECFADRSLSVWFANHNRSNFRLFRGSFTAVDDAAGCGGELWQATLSFEANQGQSDPQVRFTSRGNGYSLFLTDSEAVLALSRKEGSKGGEQKVTLSKAESGKSPAKLSFKTDVVRMQLAGANPGLRVAGE